MKYTKEELNQLNNDPMAHRIAAMFGVDLTQLIKEEKQAIDNEKNKNKNIELPEEFKNIKNRFTDISNTITDTLDKLVEEGVFTCEEITENGITKKFYHCIDNKPEEEVSNKKEYVKPEAKVQPFLMNTEQLEKFITDYSELIENEKRLSYIYGIEFKDGNSGWGFTSKINEIIWDLIRIIFGDENAEDIADYIFGNSNFDSVKRLYDELI